MEKKTMEKPLNEMTKLNIKQIIEDDLMENLGYGAAYDGYALGFARAWQYHSNYKSAVKVHNYLNEIM